MDAVDVHVAGEPMEGETLFQQPVDGWTDR